MNSSCPWRISYGVADFVKLRQGKEYYVDKTHFLPNLEQAGRFLFLIRPRRFGKSLLQSVMECYYYQVMATQFDELFHDTWIHEHPTEEKNRYLVLRFDFSMVNPDYKKLQKLFDTHLNIRLDGFFKRYAKFIPSMVTASVLARDNSNERLEQLFFRVA